MLGNNTISLNDYYRSFKVSKETEKTRNLSRLLQKTIESLKSYLWGEKMIVEEAISETILTLTKKGLFLNSSKAFVPLKDEYEGYVKRVAKNNFYQELKKGKRKVDDEDGNSTYQRVENFYQSSDLEVVIDAYSNQKVEIRERPGSKIIPYIEQIYDGLSNGDDLAKLVVLIFTYDVTSDNYTFENIGSRQKIDVQIRKIVKSCLITEDTRQERVKMSKAFNSLFDGINSTQNVIITPDLYEHYFLLGQKLANSKLYVEAAILFKLIGMNTLHWRAFYRELFYLKKLKLYGFTINGLHHLLENIKSAPDVFVNNEFLPIDLIVTPNTPHVPQSVNEVIGDIWNELSNAYRYTEDNHMAKKAAKEAVKFHPNYITRATLCEAHLESGEEKEAFAIYKENKQDVNFTSLFEQIIECAKKDKK